jgi:hypothetical protein
LFDGTKPAIMLIYNHCNDAGGNLIMLDIKTYITQGKLNWMTAEVRFYNQFDGIMPVPMPMRA